jgi:hypothetical protein
MHTVLGPEDGPTLRELADQLIDADPHGGRDAWGPALLDLARRRGLDAELDRALAVHLGRYVHDVQVQRLKAAKRAALAARGELGVTHDGKPFLVPPARRRPTETLSVRDESGHSQPELWERVTPQQFLDATRRQGKVVTGLVEQQAVREGIAAALESDPELLALPTVGDACLRLGIDPDTLGLDDLGIGA